MRIPLEITHLATPLLPHVQAKSVIALAWEFLLLSTTGDMHIRGKEKYLNSFQ